MTEDWRRINGFPNYAISDDGRVMRIEPGMNAKVGKTVKFQNHHDGYFMVRLRKSGIRKVRTLQVARIVAQHYVPNPWNLPEVNHIDGNKTNNHWQNLEWVDRQGNMRHAQTLNSWRRGERHPCAKLTENDVQEIIRLRQTARVQVKELARRFGVQPHAIDKIIYGQKWKHLHAGVGK